MTGTATAELAMDRKSRRRAATARLFAEALTDDEAERARCHDEIVRLNMEVARDVAHRYRGRSIPAEDLQQVAFLGLVKAVKGFDPTLGNDFLVFAVPTIRGELRRYFRDLGWTVRPPRPIQEMQSKIIAAEGALYQQLGRAPRPSEFAEHLGVELDLVLDALAANGCFTPTSLDAPTTGEEGDDVIGNRLGFVDAGFDAAEARAALQPLMRNLDARDRRILEMRFFGGSTQAEIGAEIGVTQMQVSRLLTRLLARLRRQLEVGTAA
jgi:RNA polymerase sigma-B factor